MDNERQRHLPFRVPDIGEPEIESVVEVLRSKWLAPGPKVMIFDELFCRYLGTTYHLVWSSRVLKKLVTGVRVSE
jgi:dTDP-4-amino-4,6-dideoxygalactose transaminase